MLRLRFQKLCRLDLNQNRPFLDGHYVIFFVPAHEQWVVLPIFDTDSDLPECIASLSRTTFNSSEFVTIILLNGLVKSFSRPRLANREE